MSDYDLLREHAPATRPERQAESEASDHATDQVTAALAVQHGRPDTLGAKAATHLQRMAGNAATSSLVAQREDDPSIVHDVVGRGGGSTLDDATRASMEQSFGTDFSTVRIHSGEQASAAAKSVQAQAFTVGDDIVLGEGKSPSDTRTLAHELTHVVQQREGDVPGESIGGGLKVSDPGDWAEREAEATADHVMSHDNGGGGAADVQREAMPDDELGDDAIGRMALQREAIDDEEIPPDEV